MTPEQRAKMDRLVEAILPECEEIVRNITAQPCLTKDRYDQYMTALSHAESEAQRTILAVALCKAGANKAGVLWAMRLLSNQS